MDHMHLRPTEHVLVADDSVGGRQGSRTCYVARDRLQEYMERMLSIPGDSWLVARGSESKPTGRRCSSLDRLRVSLESCVGVVSRGVGPA